MRKQRKPNKGHEKAPQQPHPDRGTESSGRGVDSALRRLREFEKARAVDRAGRATDDTEKPF